MLIQTSQKRELFASTLNKVLLGVFAVVLISVVWLGVRPQGTDAAATNSTLNFQARLESADGAIAPDGTYNVEFKLYDASTGGTNLWTEDYTSTSGPGSTDVRVRVANGYLSVNLGSINPFPNTINWDQQLYLTMNIGGTSNTVQGPSSTYPTGWDGEMSPRLPLTAVPYAFKAGQLAQYNNATGYESTLSIQAPTGGNQTFQIQDQGAAGTYNLLTTNQANAGYVQLQGSTPGTTQTGYFNISGTGIAGTLQAGTFDTASSGALNIGTNHATSILLQQNTSLASGKTLTVNGSGFDANGNLGIGTTSPGANIDIQNAATTGNAVNITANSLTSGNAINVGQSLNYSSPTNISSSLLNINRALTTNIATSAITLDSTSSGSTASSTSLTWAHTVGSVTNRYLLVSVSIPTAIAAPTSVTYNGVSMTLLGSANDSYRGNMFIYGLVAPATGTHNVIVTLPSSGYIAGSASSWYNVNQSSPTGSFNKTTGNVQTQTLTTTTSSGEEVVDFLATQAGNTITPGAGQTNLGTVAEGTDTQITSSYIASAGASTTTSMSFGGSWQPSSYEAVALNKAAAASSTFAGNIVNLTSSCSSTTGSCADTSNILNLNQQFSGATGTVLNIQNAGSGDFLDAVNGSGTVLTSINSAGLLTTNAGVTINAGGNFVNGGSTLNASKALSLGASGAIGTAAATVDSYTTFDITATASSLSFSLPNPTVTTSGRIVYINNVGSNAFTIGSVTINAGASSSFIWNGSSWTSTAVSTGVSLVGSYDTQTASGNGAVISGNTIYFQSASATNPGMVNTGAQTFAGNKTFSGNVTVQGTSGITAAAGVNVGAGLFDGTVTFLGPGGTITLVNDSGTASHTIDFPNASGTLALSNDTTDFIRNQTSLQASSNFNISGTGIAGSLQAASLDTTSVGGTLTVGGTNATSISIGQNTTLAAGKAITITGGNTASRPASPSKGMLYFDSATNQLIQYNGSKWVSAPRTATEIVAASNSTQAEKDAADFVATGSNDQTTINNALAALPASGGTVYLMEGTYTLGTTSVSVPDNTTLAGSGAATILTYPNSLGSSIYYAITNSDTSTGTHVNIQNLLIDGNKANQTSGTFYGIYFNGMGNGTTRDGGKINNVVVRNLYSTSSDGIYLGSSNNNTIIGNTVLAGGGNGIYFNTSSSSNTVTGNIVQGNTGAGISVGSGSYNTITGNTVQNNTGNGIYLFSSNNTVTGNTVQGNGGAGGQGIALSVSSYNTITGNIVLGNGSYGIYLFSSSNNNTISNNTVQGSSSYGIELGIGTYNTVSGNNITGGQFGIDMSGNNNMVSGNRVGSTSQNGITIFNAQYNTITGNYLYDNGASASYSAIYLNSASSPYASYNTVTNNNVVYDTVNGGYAVYIKPNSANNYLSNNSYTGPQSSAVSDSGTGTIYANQSGTNGGTINLTPGGGFTIGASSATASLTLQGGLVNSTLPVPTLSSTVTNVGTTGSTTYRYQITALDGTGETTGSTIQQTTTGNATLSGTNYNTITWTAVPGAVNYNIYRCTGAACTPAKLATVAGNATSYSDKAAGSPSGTAPASNTTGGGTFAGLLQGSSGTFTSGSLTLGTSSTSTGSIKLYSASGSGSVTLTLNNPGSNNYTLSIPTLSGNDTICTVGAGNCAGAPTLQNAYTNSVGGTTPEIILDSTRQSVDIQGYSGQSADLLDLRSYAATGLGTLQFGVDPSGNVNAAGTIASTDIYIDSGLLSTNSSDGTVATGGPLLLGSNIDTIASGGTISIGLTSGGNATAINLNQNTTVASGKTFTANNSGFDGSGNLHVGTNGTATGQLYVSGNVPSGAVGTANLSNAAAVAVSGRYAYVASYPSTLTVYDISNPASPVSVGSASTGTYGNSIAVAGHYLYLATTTSQKLQIFDISNPTIPVNVGNLSFAAAAYTVAVSGRYAYVGVNNNTLQVVDISNPANPVSVGSTSDGSTNGVQSLAVQGRYVYMTDYTNTPASNFHVVDVSNPASPSVVGNYKITGSTTPGSVYVQGSYAYVTDYNGNKLEILNISNPTSPTSVASATSTNANSVYVQGRYAYVAANGGVQVFDISNPASPTSVGIATAGGPSYVVVSGRYAYTTGYAAGKFQIFDLGGAYTQQLEAGGIELGTLNVDGNSLLGGDASIQGALTVGQSLQVGGNIGTAGNIMSTGTLQGGSLNAGSSSQFQVDASGDFVTTGGTGTIKTTSTTAFSVQNASSDSFFNVDTSTGTISIGDIANGNNITISSTGITAYGTARHVKILTFEPEYAGAVLDVQNDSTCTSTTNGTMTSGFDGTHSYYNWTSSQTSTQCYDVVLRVPMPSDFGAWDPNTTGTVLTVNGYTTDTTNGTISMQVLSPTGSVQTAWASVPLSTANSWHSVGQASGVISWTPGQIFTLQFRMSAANAASVRLGTVQLYYYTAY